MHVHPYSILQACVCDIFGKNLRIHKVYPNVVKEKINYGYMMMYKEELFEKTAFI